MQGWPNCFEYAWRLMYWHSWLRIFFVVLEAHIFVVLAILSVKFAGHLLMSWYSYFLNAEGASQTRFTAKGSLHCIQIFKVLWMARRLLWVKSGKARISAKGFSHCVQIVRRLWKIRRLHWVDDFETCTAANRSLHCVLIPWSWRLFQAWFIITKEFL